jgi:hypothetical protein
LKILLLGGCFCFRQSFTFTNNEKKWFLVWIWILSLWKPGK